MMIVFALQYDIIEDLNRESRSGGNAALASLGQTLYFRRTAHFGHL